MLRVPPEMSGRISQLQGPANRVHVGFGVSSWAASSTRCQPAARDVYLTGVGRQLSLARGVC